MAVCAEIPAAHLLGLPWELLDQILSPILQAWSVDGIVKAWSIGETSKDELLLTATKSHDSLNLTLVCKQFLAICRTLDQEKSKRSRCLRDFGGIYRATSPRYIFENCTRHYLEQGWGVNNGHSIAEIMSLDVLRNAIRVLEIPSRNRSYFEDVDKVIQQFPNLEQVVIEVHRRSPSFTQCFDDEDMPFMSSSRFAEPRPSTEIECLLPWVLDMKRYNVTVWVRWFISHRHQRGGIEKHTSVLVGNLLGCSISQTMQFKSSRRECLEKRCFSMRGKHQYMFTPGQRCRIRRLSEESISDHGF